ncbi:MAG TPA: cob(I)yrinic acid a,c-diamide adenosyltransferase, partial [Candidatus Aenigmarchaeota archaeon]|nr:cob(I)yrinic acid a,c-diamide adenosyltransferase [Candidatus Aenigmarchaeota archaeon]
DELNVAVHFNLLDINYVLRKLKEIPREVNIIITGRKAKKEIIEIADIASEMKELKHHFRKGVKAVKAIDY